MTLHDRKLAFAELGKFLGQFATFPPQKADDVRENDSFFNDMAVLVERAQHHNGWFTPEQVALACESWHGALTPSNLEAWTKPYLLDTLQPRTVALILAGNIPLVGFHDLVSVLITGHNALVRLSSNDNQLVPLLARYLAAINPQFESRITFTESKLEGFDAVIATGSNNTSRYFEYYFRDKPAIIRKNRNSVAILDGSETKEELHALGEDIFRYFGLGCRNVSKLFVPEGYDFKDFFEAIFPYGSVIHYEKYANNYDYNKAVFLMSNFKLTDNGFLTLKEDSSYASPISSVFYEHYTSKVALSERLTNDGELLQCVVGHGHLPFGKTQRPELWDYADNVDTLAFLTGI